MMTLADTVLGDAGKLADMHDLLLLKAEVFNAENTALAEELRSVAVILGEAADAVVSNVEYTLAVYEFPMAMKVRKTNKLPDDVVSKLAKAIQLYPAGKVPKWDIALVDIPGALAKIQQHFEAYLANKDATIAFLMAHKQVTHSYLMTYGRD